MFSSERSRLRRVSAVIFVLSLVAVAFPLAAPAAAGHGTCAINVTPDTDTNTLGDTHTLTATLVAPAGQTADTCRAENNVPISFEITGETGATYNPNTIDAASTPATPDLACTIKNNETACTVDYTRTATPGTDSITGFFTDAGVAGATGTRDTVTKTWQAPSATRLNCEPETATNPTGTVHTVTCTVTNNAGATVNGAQVDVEITGANDPDNADSPASPDRTCTTATNGTCTFTLTGPNAGTTTFRSWIDADNNDTTGAGGDTTEAQAEGTTPGATAEPDATDVVTKTWTATATPTTTRLDCNPETDTNPTGSAHVITCSATSSTGANVAGAQVDVEATGANDPDNADSPASPDFTCTTANNGTCSFTHGTGGVGTTANAGTTTYRAWIDFDASNATGGPDATEGQAEATTPGATAEPDATDVVTKTWVVNDTRTLDCEPETATNPVNTQHTITCTARNSAGQPVAGEAVTFTSSGPGTLTANSPTTGNDGTVTATITSSQQGTQSVTGTVTDDLNGNEPTDVDECDRAANDPTGTPAGACADTVTKTWTGPAPGAFCPGFENDPRNQVVGTIGDDNLTGTEGADIICGLAGNDTLTGLGGNDLLIGGGGNDSLAGGDGDDQLRGGGGSDVLAGGAGNDTLKGGRGSDVLLGGAGNDLLAGGAGGDVLNGGGGSDFLRGGAGNDSMNGGRGRDRCRGGPGRDTAQSC